MVLDGEDGELAVTEAFAGLIVEIDFRLLNILGQRFRIDGKAVILGRDGYFPGDEIFHRLVSATMSELEFEGAGAEGLSQNLMPETDAEDRFLSDQFTN